MEDICINKISKEYFTSAGAVFAQANCITRARRITYFWRNQHLGGRRVCDGINLCHGALDR